MVPEVFVYAIEGRSNEQKKRLMQKITTAVEETFKVPAERIVVHIVEGQAHNKSRGGITYDER